MNVHDLSFLPFKSSDIEDLFRICQDEDLRRYLMEGMEMSYEDCESLVSSNSVFLSENLVGLYMIKLNDKAIGYGGFKDTFPKSDEIDFMYAIVGECFGKGIGSEVARKLLEIYKMSGANKILTAVVNPENRASIKILEKNRFVHKGKAPGELSHLELYIRF